MSSDMLEFVYHTIEVSTTKEDAVSPAIAKKLLDSASRISFLDQFEPKVIDRRDSETLSIESKRNAEITIHPNGSFHIEFMGGSIKTLATVEKWISQIATLFVKSGAKPATFDVDFRSHTDIKSKSQLAAISRIFNSIRISSAFADIQRISTPTYLVTRIKPHESAKSMYISYHPEFVDLTVSLKPLAPKMMKNRFLINAVGSLVSVLNEELGESS